MSDLSPTQILGEPPFFIIGSGRSGTTLMRSLLSAHSRLTVTPETHFLKFCKLFSGRPIDRKPADFDAVWDRYCASPRFAALDVSRDACEAYFPQGRKPNYAEAFAALLRAYLDKSGKSRVGEKTPSHLHQADWLLAKFPDARMIVMRRDPRAMIASLIKTPWRRAEDDMWRSILVRRTRLHAVARDARRWAWVNGEILPKLERDPRVIAIRYEDLVHDPEAALRSVTKHLDETFEPAILQPRDEADPDPAVAGVKPEWTPWLRKHEASSRSSIDASSLSKWQADLSRAEIAVIEALTCVTMRRFGYRDDFSSAGQRRKAVALSAVARTACEAELAARRVVRRMLDHRANSKA